jgi:CheY-like chemotaxis protein
MNNNNKSQTVLLVDDESPWLEAMTIVLRNESYNVITANSGEEALKKLETKKPDLILADIRMPVMNGFDLYEKIRDNPGLKSVPYVFMSSMDDFDAKKVAQDLGADDYVTKPYDINDVKTIVLDLLKKFKEKR